jgi:hypothetical protein
MTSSGFNNAQYNDDNALLEAAVSQHFSQTDLDSRTAALHNTAAELEALLCIAMPYCSAIAL